MQSFDEIKDLAGGRFVQVAGRFVGQQQPRIVDQGACEGYTLLLAAGKFAGPVIAAVFKANLFKPVSSHHRSEERRVG